MVWQNQEPTADQLQRCIALYGTLAATLQQRGAAALPERSLALRAAVAAGDAITLEVTSGERREVIRSGEPLDRAGALFTHACVLSLVVAVPAAGVMSRGQILTPIWQMPSQWLEAMSQPDAKGTPAASSKQGSV